MLFPSTPSPLRSLSRPPPTAISPLGLLQVRRMLMAAMSCIEANISNVDVFVLWTGPVMGSRTEYAHDQYKVRSHTGWTPLNNAGLGCRCILADLTLQCPTSLPLPLYRLHHSNLPSTLPPMFTTRFTLYTASLAPCCSLDPILLLSPPILPKLKEIPNKNEK
ncbi:hypothetical protein BKA70DRAFT_1276995 [Coprinopsis sp. MPI-PUGE-AT-0042]|nr:hypothetical protein BKA70DRAFT_1276995 [Coprinopsis sp. MPI-PUGE-AT-0042]